MLFKRECIHIRHISVLNRLSICLKLIVGYYNLQVFAFDVLDR